MKYPKIERDNIDFLSNSDICNTGYYEGKLNDDRPIRCETWFTNGVDNVTCFISKIDLKKVNVLNLLIDNKIVEIIEGKYFIDEVIDINENEFYAINIPLNYKDTIYNKLLININTY